ncbi:MAG: YncE family protein, partial [Acidimicrobiales bacterium]
INLASCVTPSGAACQDPVLRPDNAPICPVVDAGSRLTFVTLRGGGMFVVDTTAGSPMAIVAEYDRATVHPNGCGGVEAAGKLYLNSGGGTAANPVEADLYAFDLAGFQGLSVPNTPAPRLVFSHDSRGFVDSHGATLAGARSRYLWVADRAANRVVVVDTAGDAVVGEIDLAGAVSADPAPDLADVSPQGHRVYVALRGPVPLTGNAPAVNNAAGATPGLGIIRVEAGGADGALQAVNRVSNVGADGLERADPHVLRVRRT